MAPNAEFISDIVPIYNVNAPIEITVVEIDWYGQPILFDAIDDQDVNYSLLLEQAIEFVPLFENYIGCGNCGMPICKFDEIIDVIPAVHHSYVAVGYVLNAISNSMITWNTNLKYWSTVFWQTRLTCANCNILLTVPALTVINQNIIRKRY